VATLAPEPNQVVYILDRDLIRFVKFAGAVLALFILVGAILWGFDIKQAADKVRDATDKVRDALYKVQDAQTVISKTAGEVEENRKSVQAYQQQVQDSVTKAQQAQQQTQELLSKIQQDVLEADRYTELLKRGGPDSGPPETIRRSISKTASAPFSVPQIAKLYDFPTEFDGKGQTIGLIELGGGYQDSDLDAYFTQLGLPKPKVTWISVKGAKNHPGTEADAQVTLDIEVAGAVAPGASIVIYFAPNTNQGFLDAVKAAIADKTNRPSILTISWGSPESTWALTSMQQMNDALQTAAKQGMTVVTAAGDGGVTDGVTDRRAHVDFPASSPWVLAVGGTRLTESNGKIISEVVWNDQAGGATGGGVSDVFPQPDWQVRANVPVRKDGGTGRGIPDVAANAAPASGYKVYFHGQATVVGGTSATGPLWAGLIALINQGAGRHVGYINPFLYSKIGPAGVLRSITEGNNSIHGVEGCSAGPGWNACTGWGSPNGRNLLTAFRPH
jgi:kumamolisin